MAVVEYDAMAIVHADLDWHTDDDGTEYADATLSFEFDMAHGFWIADAFETTAIRKQQMIAANIPLPRAIW